MGDDFFLDGIPLTGEILTFAERPAFLLDNPENIWFVCAGRVRIFSVPVAGGDVAGRRDFLFDAAPGQVLFGLLTGDSRNTGLLACLDPGTRLLRAERQHLMEMAASDAHAKKLLATWLEGWVNALSAAVCRYAPPKDYEILQAGREVIVWKDCFLRPGGNVLWVKSPAGTLRFLGMDDLPLTPREAFFPVSPAVWFSARENDKLQVLDTAGYLEENAPWTALRSFHLLVLKLSRRQHHEAEAEERRRLLQKTRKDRDFVEKALTRLSSVVKSGQEEVLDDDSEDPLLWACRRVGDDLRINFVAPPRRDGKAGYLLEDILKASHIRARRVILKGNWWRQDSGPCLAYMEEDGRPVALVPARGNTYELYDSLHREKYPLTNALIRSLKPFAYVFYRPFPARALSAVDLLAFGLSGRSGRDVLMLVLWGAAAGILGLAAPAATGILFDTVIPEAERTRLLQVTAFLLASAVAAASFQASQSIVVLRLGGKIDACLQSAVWDRLLNLPVPFFRNYATGDLASRANSINMIIRTLSGAGLASIFAGVFSCFNLGLLFYYDAGLAVWALVLTLSYLVVFALLGYFEIRYARQALEIEGRIAGLALQILGGIAKFRMAGAENRAFYLWARSFSEQRKITYKARTVANHLTAFNAVYPLLTSMLIFYMMVTVYESRMSTGAFLAFNAAFSGFIGAMAGLTATILSTANIIPLYERATPILQTMPEIDAVKADPGQLTGDIEISRVSFRYHQGGPLVLQDVSLRVRPGEFIAVVGASGSGKSTLLRLLLGFETPESGAVYYDGQDLAGLDVQSVRRQMGVVLQNSQLLPGNIFENIVGSLPLTLDDAWEAAAMVGLADDIQQMPMKMHTVITAGASTLSGGQRQRIVIARAIVNKPRIIIFDEATSALDNRTQAEVSKSLEGLNATRVVIAHRLSTIINADRIYVLDQGRIVQCGTYAELINREGPFAAMARRQLA